MRLNYQESIRENPKVGALKALTHSQRLLWLLLENKKVSQSEIIGLNISEISDYAWDGLSTKNGIQCCISHLNEDLKPIRARVVLTKLGYQIEGASSDIQVMRRLAPPLELVDLLIRNDTVSVDRGLECFGYDGNIDSLYVSISRLRARLPDYLEINNVANRRVYSLNIKV